MYVVQMHIYYFSYISFHVSLAHYLSSQKEWKITKQKAEGVYDKMENSRLESMPQNDFLGFFFNRLNYDIVKLAQSEFTIL